VRWKYTVNDIIANNWSVVESLGLNSHQLGHLHNISECHTPALGGVLRQCTDCGHQQYIYHSCRNRHCPSCQGSKREEWISKQQEYLLDVPYYHVVFTIPQELHSLCIHRPRQLYDTLFRSSWETITTLSKDPKYLGAKTGMTAILHTWSQTLGLHPHLHCIVPAGGVNTSGKWKSTRTKGNYLYPAKVMSTIYRAIFMRELKALHRAGHLNLTTTLGRRLYGLKWVVYAKRPFARPIHVIEYLGRYTHKVAISNYRILSTDKGQVSLRWKDYRHGSVLKVMTLPIAEFIRRFALHILPRRYVRIRHYGILSCHGRNKIIPHLQVQQEYQPIIEQITHRALQATQICPICKSPNLIDHILLKERTRAP